MKRFWAQAAARECDEGWTVELDGRPVRTPGRALLALPTAMLAEAVADEWRGAAETVDPRAMPLTGLANAAIDHAAADPEAFAGTLAAYAETDLFCYRVDSPAELARLQAARWDPLLAWARRRFDVDFRVTSSITHVAQPEATVARLRHAVAALDAFRLAGLSPLVTIGGSLVAGLAVMECGASAEQAWDAVSLDEAWQIERWGADEEAVARLAARRGDFLLAARFLALLG